MAEAVAAMGFASNALQIVVFGARVVKTAYKLSSSTIDALREDVELALLFHHMSSSVF